ncbi:pentapeptide repeat-containing protein [Anabaena sp. UHCC 0253]|uniref:pentapeptide repeat-containing protein n=1 Tax=Anabaena sp. UHCC 0253 TaxID=2590019 RepID=UPI001447AC9A|nr:pentapeptide repeat-containing protein [Anabaena sp. UHCC 0253]MTJ52840.1 pentapeptide repeat-containing protein [Anabaena sp. UHCC 0253]
MSNDDINIQNNRIIFFGLFIGFIFISVVIYPISIILTTGEWTELLEKKYEYVIKVLTTAGLIFGGIVGLINIFFAAKRAYAMEGSAKAANESAIAANKNAEIALENIQIARKNLKISEDKQITESFAKAIEQLASEKIAVRLGAIYTLERIAKYSEKDQWTIMEVLTAFVRQNAPVIKENESQSPEDKEKFLKLRIYIQACLTVIGERKHPDLENKRLDLTEVNISGFNLEGFNLTGANLAGANLTGAYLFKADLTGAVLFKANLTGANLFKADLEEAKLFGADLEEAKLFGANLTGADLEGANLIGADLTGANLTEAYLEGADLTGAKLVVADLTEADLAGTDLTQANLREAYRFELITAQKTKVLLTEADLEGAILTRATMPDGSIHD